MPDIISALWRRLTVFGGVLGFNIFVEERAGWVAVASTSRRGRWRACSNWSPTRAGFMEGRALPALAADHRGSLRPVFRSRHEIAADPHGLRRGPARPPPQPFPATGRAHARARGSSHSASPDSRRLPASAGRRRLFAGQINGRQDRSGLPQSMAAAFLARGLARRRPVRTGNHEGRSAGIGVFTGSPRHDRRPGRPACVSRAVRRWHRRPASGCISPGPARSFRSRCAAGRSAQPAAKPMSRSSAPAPAGSRPPPPSPPQGSPLCWTSRPKPGASVSSPSVRRRWRATAGPRRRGADRARRGGRLAIDPNVLVLGAFRGNDGAAGSACCAPASIVASPSAGCVIATGCSRRPAMFRLDAARRDDRRCVPRRCCAAMAWRRAAVLFAATAR